MAALASLIGPAAGVGCGDDGPADSDPDPDAATVCEAAGPVEVRLTTDDGVELVADAYTTGRVGDPGVVLLHMTPVAHTKANYPASFIGPLVDRGFQVINVNRRGATGSGGEVADAFLGPDGKLDAKAGHDFLLDHPCAVPPDAVAVVGASNGTTTAVDFSVHAAAAADLEQPFAMVFLSGGAYTENQHAIADVAATLANHPILFAFPAAEAAWNRGIEATAPASWQFHEYDPGGHGTNLFDSDPAIVQTLVDFLADAAGR